LEALLKFLTRTARLSDRYLESDSPEGFVRRSLQDLAGNSTAEATKVLEALQADPTLIEWQNHFRHHKAEQRRIRSEAEFVRPSAEALVAALNNGSPANPADLRALTEHVLVEVANQIRHGDADTWQRFWNLDSYTRATETLPEEAARDVLLDLMRPRLSSLGVSCEREGDMANHKRCDIRVTFTNFIVPVEIKKQSHTALWTAPVEQLDRLYANDPRAGGQGVYLALWYGEHGPAVTAHPLATSPLASPEILLSLLHEGLPEGARERLGVVVIDASIPPGAKTSAVKGSGGKMGSTKAGKKRSATRKAKVDTE
jgi:hypothetical protein